MLEDDDNEEEDEEVDNMFSPPSLKCTSSTSIHTSTTYTIPSLSSLALRVTPSLVLTPTPALTSSIQWDLPAQELSLAPPAPLLEPLVSLVTPSLGQGVTEAVGEADSAPSPH